MNPNVDEYLKNAKLWREEIAELRAIVLSSGLKEDWKWRAPCYTHAGANIAMIGAFKDNCVLSFFKGALLKDPQGLLEKPGANTQAARVIRFTDSKTIAKLAPTLKSYLRQAMEIEKAGLKVEKTSEPEPVPEELQTKFDERPDFEQAFFALTPGRQRAYLMFFAAAKQSTTRTSRIEKYTQQILDGKGMNDCTCGLSKKMPGCDGSHKVLG